MPDLDEATSALDAVSRVLVFKFEAIKKWRRSKTTVVITHDLSQISSDDFVYVLRSGEVVEQGYRADLEGTSGEFSRMLSVQGSADGFQERTDEELREEEVELEAILEQADAEKEEELEATGLTAKDLKRHTGVYRPLTMSHWMFDVVHDLTKSSAAPTTAPSASPIISPKAAHRTSRFIPAEAFSDAPATAVSPTRHQSTYFNMPTIASPPPAHSLSRRDSLQFTSSSPSATRSSFFSSTVVGEEETEEKTALERHVLHPSRSMSTIAGVAPPKRERIKWDKGRLIELTEVKVDKNEEPTEIQVPSQPSFLRLIYDIWPTVPLKPLVFFGIVVSVASGVV